MGQEKVLVKALSTTLANSTKLVHAYNEQGINGQVHCGDALDFLNSLRTASAGIIFLDPPFNLGKVYGEKYANLDRRPEDDYEQWLIALLQESTRVLMPGGALYLYHLPAWAMRLGTTLNRHLQFQHWIAISMKNGFVRGPHLYPAHYALLYFTKGKPVHFRRPKLKPATCRHCGKTVKDYGGYRKIIDEKGVNLSDFWDDLSPVRHRSTKNRSANELPKAMFDRIIEIKKVSWNFKTAIPQYYPRVKKLQLLLPICLVSDQDVDLALAVERTPSLNYLAHTMFPLDLAYRNARLVCKPNSDWLDPEEITEVAEEQPEE